MVNDDGHPNTLIIESVRAEHAGLYGCAAAPDFGANCHSNVTIFTAMNATLSIIGKHSPCLACCSA